MQLITTLSDMPKNETKHKTKYTINAVNERKEKKSENGRQAYIFETFVVFEKKTINLVHTQTH